MTEPDKEREQEQEPEENKRTKIHQNADGDIVQAVDLSHGNDMSQWSAGSNASREENDVNGQPQEAHKARDALILRDGDDLGSDDENNVVQQDDRRCNKDTVQPRETTKNATPSRGCCRAGSL